MTFPAASHGHSRVPAPPASLGLVGFRQLLPNLSSVDTPCEVPDPAGGRPAGVSRLAGDALQGSSHPAVTQAPLDQGQSLGSGPPPFPALRLSPLCCGTSDCAKDRKKAGSPALTGARPAAVPKTLLLNPKEQ